MTKKIIVFASTATVLLVPMAALAYIGPGAGASLAGSLLAVLAAIVTAIAIVLFWPLRLLYKKLKANKRTNLGSRDQAQGADEATTPGAAE